MSKYPHTIENGDGEALTFLGVVSDSRGDRLEAENRLRPGAGPPMHVHHLQEEALTVIEGRMGYQIAGEKERYASAGESVVFPPGQAHRFWNAGEDELLCRGYLMPPLNVEYLLTTMFASMRSEGGRPDLLDAAYLLTRYRSEYGAAMIPDFVQRYVFPIMIGLGRLIGKYEKFRDAPEPAERITPQERAA